MTEPLGLIASIVIAGLVGFALGIFASAAFVAWAHHWCIECLHTVMLRVFVARIDREHKHPPDAR